jgi:RsiW-degrading membrane proteinase PrsW (M82 family)
MTAAPPRRVDWRRILPLALVVAVCLAGGVGILFVIGYNIGPLPLAIGIAAAVLPVPFLISAFLWLDRYEPEPTIYLAFCFAWGAGVAAFAAYQGNTHVADLFKKAGLPSDLVAVLVAPVIEESMKALGPVLLLLFTLWKKRRTFNGIVDAIVFFGLSATGFAMSENILYLGGYGYAQGADKGGVAGGLNGVIAVFIGRIPLSGFAHPLFTSMTAVGVGVAIRSTDKRVRWIAPIAGLLAAMVLHGSWNLMATLAQDTGHAQILLYGYFSVMMPIFLGMVGFAMWLRSAEGRLTQTALSGYVRAGWLSPPEVASLASIGRRRSARTWAKRVAGDPGADGMRGFQLAATQLALLRDRLDRRAAAGLAILPAETTEEQQLLWLISSYRSAYVGRDPLTPRARWDGSHYHISFPDGVVRVINAPTTPVVPVPMVRAPMPPYPMPPYGYPYPPPPTRA